MPLPTAPLAHAEAHFTSSQAVRDVVIGMADGLTVPFALAAGLSGAVASTSLVVTAGLAEIAAGSIAMGLGGYLAARTDQEHYASEYRREMRETVEVPEQERRELAEIFSQHGLAGKELEAVVDAVSHDRHRWVDFMMRFELGLEKPNPRKAPVSAATIGGAYVVGGLIPLAPYIALSELNTALQLSVILTLAALLFFGAVKGRLTGMSAIKSGLQTMLVGSVAAATAFALASWIS